MEKIPLLDPGVHSSLIVPQGFSEPLIYDVCWGSSGGTMGNPVDLVPRNHRHTHAALGKATRKPRSQVVNSNGGRGQAKWT